MIKVQTKAETNGVAYTAEMEGNSDDIIREAVGIVVGLCEDFNDDADMKDDFLMLASKYILSKLKEKCAELEMMDAENKGGDFFA